MTSIRRKLLFTLLAALLAAGFSAAAATFFSAQAEFNDFLDAHLRETAESLADSVRSSMPMHAPEHLTIIGDAPSYRIIVQSTTLPTIVCGNVRILQPCHCLTVLVLDYQKWMGVIGVPIP